MATYAELSRELIKGDLFSEDLTFTRTGTTWTNVVITAKVREGTPEGTVVYTLSITPTISGDSISFTYSIPAATTATLDAAKTYFGDVRIQADGFGPMTVLFFTFNIKPTTNN